MNAISETSVDGPALRTVTLGCKVNQYETEYVRQGLEAIGYRTANDGESADLCIVNTCTVTHEGDAKSRQTIRQLAKRNPGTRIVVMGCYATRAPDEVAQLPGVAEVITDKRELPDLLGRFGVVDIPRGISRFAGRQRAYVKVQDGCLLRCSFCIIPQVRPTMVSRPLEEIVAEVRRLVDNNYREIILTGIHLGHYGVDFNRGRNKTDWTRLSHLVEKLVAIPGQFRIRLSSIEATEVTRELIGVMAAHPTRVCPHLHVCLQSGSDRILRRMRRRWCSRRIVDRCQMIQERLDLPALTTDVIVGFPGETDADFRDTLDVCETISFSKVHVFPYSRRKGTIAAESAEQVYDRVRIERCAELDRLQVDWRRRYFEQLVGRELQVILEPSHSEPPGMKLGTSCRYAPVELPATAGSYGEMVSCIVKGVNGQWLAGEIAWNR